MLIRLPGGHFVDPQTVDGVTRTNMERDTVVTLLFRSGARLHAQRAVWTYGSSPGNTFEERVEKAVAGTARAINAALSPEISALWRWMLSKRLCHAFLSATKS